LSEDIGFSLSRSRRAERDRYVAILRAQLDDETFDKAWAEGKGMTEQQAIEYAVEVRDR
jgi:hypothetical protein